MTANTVVYLFEVLMPRSSLRVDLKDQSGKVRRVKVMAKIRQTKTIMDSGDLTGRDAWRLRMENEDQRRPVRPQYKELGKELMILKLANFSPGTNGPLVPKVG